MRMLFKMPFHFSNYEDKDKFDKHFTDPHDLVWNNLLSNLDRTMAEINKIDRDFDYPRLKFILEHDPINHGYDDHILELYK